MDCSVGGLRVGSAAAGVRRCGERIPALPHQLRGDGFCGDTAAEASLGPLTPLQKPEVHGQCTCTYRRGMSDDHSSGVATPKTDPVFLHVRAGMTVIVKDGSDWRMAADS